MPNVCLRTEGRSPATHRGARLAPSSDCPHDPFCHSAAPGPAIALATSGSRGRLTSDESFAAIGIVRGRGRLRGPRRRPRPAGLQGRRLRRFTRRSRASNAAPLGYSPPEDGPSGPGFRRRVDDLRVRGLARTSRTFWRTATLGPRRPSSVDEQNYASGVSSQAPPGERATARSPVAARGWAGRGLGTALAERPARLPDSVVCRSPGQASSPLR